MEFIASHSKGEHHLPDVGQYLREETPLSKFAEDWKFDLRQSFRWGEVSSGLGGAMTGQSGLVDTVSKDSER